MPIGLGYLSVSFGFGIMAVKSGLTTLVAALISASNLTSAGQAAGIGIIAAGGTLVEMALVQLTINLRYSLMALSLSQKLDSSFTTPHKLIASFGITDEIFAVSSGRRERLTPWYMYGMILVAFAGWVGGTVLGASAGELLPASVSSALSIMLYGMFIAIVVPPAKKEKGIVTAAAVAVALSVVFKYLIPSVSSGFTVIICSIAASAAGAFLFPKEDDEE
jgi:predicted branched-subunit amino acid permease